MVLASVLVIRLRKILAHVANQRSLPKRQRFILCLSTRIRVFVCTRCFLCTVFVFCFLFFVFVFVLF